jgi:TRAP-type C4-dicarboxylate transport system permease small subunit
MTMERIRQLETWARLGYAARGIVYLVLGWIALSTGKAMSTDETVQAVEDFPGGAPLLALLALGLLCYGGFKIYSAILDLDDKGDDAKGWVMRGARIAGGLAYLLLAFVAAKQLFGDRKGAVEAGQASGSSGANQDAAAQVSDSAGGETLLVVIGVVVLIVAASQLWIAYKAKFSDEMPGAPHLVKPAGQIGYAARAIIIAITGYFAIQAGLDGERVRTSGDALALVRSIYPLAFKLIAGGLILFGLVSLLMARYRRIADEDVVARLKSNVPHANQ